MLKADGGFAVSDVVVRGHIAAAIKKSLEFWAGCVAGAFREGDYMKKLAQAGSDQIGIETTRVYGHEDAWAFLTAQGV